MKLNSYTLTQGRNRAAARSYLKATGLNDDDLKKPIIGIANTWTETMNCNYKLRDLAVHVKEGIRAAGGTPMEFNTIAISDGITMGTEGMKTSLVSREVIADSIELMARGHMFDGIVALVACDKTIPGAGMALLRLNVPGVILYGGSILPGRWRNKDITILDVFEAMGANAAGKMSDDELLEIENHACPGAGACGGQFTANTMATVMELIGLSPMGTAAVPQVDIRKEDVARRCGEVILNCVRKNIRPRAIATRKAFSNAIAGVAASGGSTNAVLHLLAMAREAEVELDIVRLPDHQRAHAPLRRPQARRQIQCRRCGSRRRHRRDRQTPRRGQLRRSFRAHLHRPHVRRRSRQGRGDPRPAGDPAARQTAEADRWSRHPARHARAGFLRHQTLRPQQAQTRRSRRAFSIAKKTPSSRSMAGRSSRTTSS